MHGIQGCQVYGYSTELGSFKAFLQVKEEGFGCAVFLVKQTIFRFDFDYVIFFFYLRY